MPYEVMVPETTVLKSIGEITLDNGRVMYEHVAIMRYMGEILPDEDVSPAVVALYDEDDEWTTSMLRRVAEARKPVQESGPDETWSRSRLNDHAESLGVESPEEMPNKAMVLKAISEAEG